MLNKNKLLGTIAVKNSKTLLSKSWYLLIRSNCVEITTVLNYLLNFHFEASLVEAEYLKKISEAALYFEIKHSRLH